MGIINCKKISVYSDHNLFHHFIKTFIIEIIESKSNEVDFLGIDLTLDTYKGENFKTMIYYKFNEKKENELCDILNFQAEKFIQQYPSKIEEQTTKVDRLFMDFKREHIEIYPAIKLEENDRLKDRLKINKEQFSIISFYLEYDMSEVESFCISIYIISLGCIFKSNDQLSLFIESYVKDVLEQFKINQDDYQIIKDNSLSSKNESHEFVRRLFQLFNSARNNSPSGNKIIDNLIFFLRQKSSKAKTFKQREMFVVEFFELLFEKISHDYIQYTFIIVFLSGVIDQFILSDNSN